MQLMYAVALVVTSRALVRLLIVNYPWYDGSGVGRSAWYIKRLQVTPTLVRLLWLSGALTGSIPPTVMVTADGALNNSPDSHQSIFVFC